MYLDKEEAIKLAASARQVILKLQDWTPDEPGMEDEREEINVVITDLEYSLEKLDSAIENSPTK
ncbi:MAG: hypothetical protein BWY47_01899 [Bacteroidetes bacterium ADurb.Bin302]|nr:MAG: hypothetical protein BWY47_01899 [Bacteroidetes bacterium ADurb.Bin302]